MGDCQAKHQLQSGLLRDCRQLQVVTSRGGKSASLRVTICTSAVLFQFAVHISTGVLLLQVIAACYDNPIPGYGTNTVGNLRLWEAKPVNEFDLEEFNEGHYVEVQQYLLSECSCSMGSTTAVICVQWAVCVMPSPV